MAFMTWTLSRPTTEQFDRYYKLKDGESWNSDKYELVDPTAVSKFSNQRVRGFVEMLEKYPNKFSAIGMHEFGISDNGDIFNMGYGEIKYPNGYYYNDPNKRVLSEDDNEIDLPVPTSLRYFMHKYPNIRWALQFLATANLSGDRVTPILNNERKPLFTAVDYSDDVNATFEPKRDADGNIIYVNAQDEFIRQSKRIAELYIEAGFPIADIEIDMEKTFSEAGEDQLFSDLLARVKREVCIPLGLGLRVNLFAMTGDFVPNYYGWHNYATVAQAQVDGVQAVDEFQLMTYDFSWGGSSAGASTPLWWLEEVLEHVKDLEDRGLWKAEDVYIGNAGYGRRWALNEDRMGVTFDFKQMVQMQNGEYIHNDGEEIVDPNDPSKTVFPFRDQDFISFAGYNDVESDYQINYPHVYDRFVLSENGGAEYSSVDRPVDANYVTNYSLTQQPTFIDVVDYKSAPDSLSGRYEDVGAVEIEGVQGLGAVTWNKYRLQEQYIHPSTNLPTGNPEDDEGRMVYTLNATGKVRLVLMVNFPFYDSNSAVIYVNGSPITVSTGDWYSFSLMQKDHFYDLGEFSASGSITVEVRDTAGVIIGGVVATKGFEHNLSGGTVTFPASTFPFYRRGERLPDGEVTKTEAQFPSSMDLVGEVLRRPPRPAIIWEDVFSSYVDQNGEGYNVLDSGYYSGAYTLGGWKAHYNGDYAHAYTDARGDRAQFSLDNEFKTDLMIETEVTVDSRDTGIYGLRLMADRGINSGYLAVVDHSAGEIRLEYYNGAGQRSVETTAPMSQSLMAMSGSRVTLKAYILGNKISFRVNDYVYINEYVPPRELKAGAYGLFIEGLRAKLYRYNLSSLERFERMERLEVTVDGELVDVYGSVDRDVEYDEYGFIIYNGYPADIAEVVKNPSDMDGETVGGAERASGTVLDIETDQNEWSLDYQNKVLARINGWIAGDHEVKVRMIDAGIWFRRFFVGDSEGMSIAYNSDKLGFIKTANFVYDYGCKGIAMWTMGQEDPTIYTFLPDVW